VLGKKIMCCVKLFMVRLSHENRRGFESMALPLGIEYQ